MDECGCSTLRLGFVFGTYSDQPIVERLGEADQESRAIYCSRMPQSFNDFGDAFMTFSTTHRALDQTQHIYCVLNFVAQTEPALPDLIEER
jgi:hypothetical protein